MLNFKVARLPSVGASWICAVVGYVLLYDENLNHCTSIELHCSSLQRYSCVCISSSYRLVANTFLVASKRTVQNRLVFVASAVGRK